MGPVRAYAANSHANTLTDINSDRLSIVTNLQSSSKSSSNVQVSFFAVYDGYNGTGCAEYLRDNVHICLSKDDHFPEQMEEALMASLKKVEVDYLKLAEKKGESCGSSALVVVIVSRPSLKAPAKCYVACVGNSRAVLSRSCGSKIDQLSVDHSPQTDR